MNPFDKSLTPSTDIALEFAIYNDGIPQSVFFGSHPEHQILQSIPEDALDCFPPNAEEAAEMDEADDFVETMAWLSYLEECDERSRNFEGLKKRWSARRADGLIGKPNPRKEVLETRARSGTLTHVSDTDLVPYLSRKFKEKPRGRMLVSQQYGHVPRNMKSNRRFGVQGPIQQPKCLKNRR